RVARAGAAPRRAGGDVDGLLAEDALGLGGLQRGLAGLVDGGDLLAGGVDVPSGLAALLAGERPDGASGQGHRGPVAEAGGLGGGQLVEAVGGLEDRARFFDGPDQGLGLEQASLVFVLVAHCALSWRDLKESKEAARLGRSPSGGEWTASATARTRRAG